MGAGLQKIVERNAETFHRTVEEMGKFTEEPGGICLEQMPPGSSAMGNPGSGISLTFS